MKKCLFCGAQMNEDEKTCPKCNRKYISKMTMIILVVVAVLSITLVGCLATGNLDEIASMFKSIFNYEKKVDLTKVEKNHQISDGYYRTGVDIPVGTALIKVVSGEGVIKTDEAGKGGYTVPMAKVAKDGYIEFFPQMPLPENTVLEVTGGIVIELNYEEVKSDFEVVKYDEKKAVEFGPGSYEVGKDIPTDTYLLTVVSGKGTISGSDKFDGGLNAKMSTEKNDEYVSELKNVLLKDKVMISIDGDLKIKFTPIK